VVGELTGYGRSSRQAVPGTFNPHVITRGHGTFVGPEGQVTIGPGDTFMLWPDVPHHFWEDPDDPWRFYWMRLQGEDVEQMVRAMGYRPDRRVMRPDDPERAIRACQSLFEHYASDDREPYRVASLLFEFVAACRRPEARAARNTDLRLVQEARALVESLLETGLNVSSLADHLHVSRQSLLSAFKAETGLTPSDYIQQARLDRARRLLAQTDLKVGAVSRACGYGNEKYFYRRFRELTDRTPGRWREEHRRSR
jgi:AraC-like DNA-binding protein